MADNSTQTLDHLVGDQDPALAESQHSIPDPLVSQAQTEERQQPSSAQHKNHIHSLGFFVSPWRQTVIDTIRNLVLLDQPLVLVTGPEGAGKTCLFEYLNHYFAHQKPLLLTWSVRSSQVSGNKGEGLNEMLCRQLDVYLHQQGVMLDSELALTEQVSTEQVLALFARLPNSKEGVRVLIDNAEHLSFSEIQALLQLVDATAFEPIQFVLFAERSLWDVFQMDPIKPLYQAYGEWVEIPAFNLKETRQFLKFYCVQQSIQSPNWSLAKLKKIQANTHGLPGRLVDWLETQSLRRSAFKLALPRLGRQVYGYVAIGLVLVLLAWLIRFVWMLPFASTESFDQNDVLSGEVFNRDISVQTPLVVEPKQVVEPTELPANHQSLDAYSAVEASSTLKDESVVETPSVTAETILLERPSNLYQQVGDIELNPSDTSYQTRIANESQESSQDAVILVQPIAPAIMQILKQDPEHYTLQMMGAHNEQAVKRFMTQTAQSEQHMMYFPTTHQGKPWYVVIYGDYPNQATAQEAARNLPAALANNTPWIRQFGHIQRQLLAKRQ